MGSDERWVVRGGGCNRMLRGQLEVARSNGLLVVGCLIVKTVYSILKNTVI